MYSANAYEVLSDIHKYFTLGIQIFSFIPTNPINWLPIWTAECQSN